MRIWTIHCGKYKKQLIREEERLDQCLSLVLVEGAQGAVWFLIQQRGPGNKRDQKDDQIHPDASGLGRERAV